MREIRYHSIPEEEIKSHHDFHNMSDISGYRNQEQNYAASYGKASKLATVAIFDDCQLKH
uniref:Uncharacterized protein n=1 Tax=Romanomermis culicivorax TaxID=13658 RepID=A0A915I4B7_ROMCU